MILSPQRHIRIDEVPDNIPAGDVGQEVDGADILFERRDGGFDIRPVGDVGAA